MSAHELSFTVSLLIKRISIRCLYSDELCWGRIVCKYAACDHDSRLWATVRNVGVWIYVLHLWCSSDVRCRFRVTILGQFWVCRYAICMFVF